MSFQWMYRSWGGADRGVARRLVADNIIQVVPGSNEFTVVGAVFYAEQSYLACRLLMLASTMLHLEALYCAGQTLEKFMKAIRKKLADSAGGSYNPVKDDGHRLRLIAETIAPHYPEFGDPEFLAVCERLDPFEIAGRYPDHNVDRWGFYLNLLTFMDGFVVHCRDLLGIPVTAADPIRELLHLTGPVNVIEVAATRAILERNDQVDKLSGYSAAEVDELRQLSNGLRFQWSEHGVERRRTFEQGATST